MADILDDVTIINRALAMIGAGAISARDDESDLSAVVNAIYDDVVDTAFGLYHWTWPRKTRKLERLNATPENGYKFAYAYPPDAMGGPEKLLTNPRNPNFPLRDFAAELRTVYCDCEAVWGIFVIRATPDLWPPLFRTAVTRALAAAFVLPVSHDKSLADALVAETYGTPSEVPRGGLMGRAIAMDASNSGGEAPLLANDPLTGARHDGPWHGDW